MRKGKTRRRHASSPTKSSQSSAGQSPKDANSNEAGAVERKQTATENEAILTSKNFRLARELNDLRVKHRDQTSITRQLTMDNRHLASKFRQALNHVEGLKKELAMYKNNTLQIAAVAERDRDYEVSPKYNIETELNTAISDDTDNLNSSDDSYVKSIVTPRHAPQDNSPVGISMRSSVDRLAARETRSSQKTDQNIRTPSPSPVTPDDSDEDSPINDNIENDSFGELRSEDYFHQTYENTLPATPEKENVDVEGMNNKFDNFMSISESGENNEHGGKLTASNSIDAFEASFQMTFPSSFADNALPPSPENNEFSDSFFMSSSSKDLEESPVYESDEDTEDADAPMDKALSFFPASTFETDMGNFDEAEEDIFENDNRASNRSGSSTATPRFDRQERIDDAPMDEASADDEEHSPTLVLKRLQQRKARQISPVPVQDGRNSLSISEELEKLDAIANGIKSPSITPSREKRRSVRQPMSYAEPSLNSKLRRGDIFFQKEKENVDNDTINEKPLKDRQTNKNMKGHSELR